MDYADDHDEWVGEEKGSCGGPSDDEVKVTFCVIEDCTFFDQEVIVAMEKTDSFC